MNTLINTVSSIFKERYGTELKIQSAKTERSETQPVFRSHWPSPFVYSRTLRQVSFPIFNSRKELKAIAVASPVENKDAIVFDEMAQFIQLTIAEHMELSDKKDAQEAREIAIEKAHSDQKKVVELRTKKTPEAIYQFKPIKPKREANLDPIWIEGTDESFNSQIAFSIHDWVGNWAFLNAKEIPDLIWQDPNRWQNFPQVTIYIPDADKLSKDEVQKLQQNLISVLKMADERPMIIVSSTGPLSTEMEIVKNLFRSYKANQRVSARVQAHFVLFNQDSEADWTHKDPKSKDIFFLPFSPGPKHIH